MSEFIMMEHERRKARRALKKAHREQAVGEVKIPTSKKYRICIKCGKPIQKRKLYYGTVYMGEAYIHVFLGYRSKEEFQNQPECRAVPRPIPSP